MNDIIQDRLLAELTAAVGRLTTQNIYLQVLNAELNKQLEATTFTENPVDVAPEQPQAPAPADD